MYQGGFVVIDFGEVALPIQPPTSSQATNIPVADVPDIVESWKHLSVNKPVIITGLTITGGSITSGFATVTELNDVFTIHFDMGNRTYNISNTGTNIVLSLA